MDDTSFQLRFFANGMEYAETTVPVFGQPVETVTFKLSQAIQIGLPQPVVRIYESPSARDEEGEGLRRWRLNRGQTYYLRVWTNRLSGPLRSDDGRLRLLDLFEAEKYGDTDAFSEVSGGARYDARISIPTAGEDPPTGWAGLPQAGWDYVLRIEMEDLQNNELRYSSAVRIEE